MVLVGVPGSWQNPASHHTANPIHPLVRVEFGVSGSARLVGACSPEL